MGRGEQGRRAARLVEIIVGAATQRLNCGLTVELGRHQDANQFRLLGLQARDKIDTRGDSAQPQVDQRDRRRVGALTQHGKRFLGGLDGMRRIAARLQSIGERLGEIDIIIDDQNRTHRFVLFRHRLPHLPSDTADSITASSAFGSNGLNSMPQVCDRSRASSSASSRPPVTRTVGTVRPASTSRAYSSAPDRTGRRRSSSRQSTLPWVIISRASPPGPAMSTAYPAASSIGTMVSTKSGSSSTTNTPPRSFTLLTTPRTPVAPHGFF